MGCYNFFEGTCPSCKKQFQVQTKLTGENFISHNIGDQVLEDGNTVKLLLKESCYECGSQIVATIKDGKLEAYTTNGAQVKEGLWGAMFSLDGPSKTEQFNSIVSDLLPGKPI